MKGWFRRIRGAIGMGLTWAAAWFGVGLVGGVLGLEAGAAAFGSAMAFLAFNSLLSAASGFFCGTAFAGVLGLIEGRRRFDQMSLLRFGGWGAVAGMIVTGLQMLVFIPLVGAPSSAALVTQLATMALLGAGCATGSLALARAAEDRELLESGEDVAAVGLTANEARNLLSGGV